MAKVKSTRERLYKSQEAKAGRIKKLKQLTDASNLPPHLGELFLSEILHSSDDANGHLRERAVLLGLAENG